MLRRSDKAFQGRLFRNFAMADCRERTALDHVMEKLDRRARLLRKPKSLHSDHVVSQRGMGSLFNRVVGATPGLADFLFAIPITD